MTPVPLELLLGTNSTLEVEDDVKLMTGVSHVREISSLVANASRKIQFKCFPVAREMFLTQGDSGWRRTCCVCFIAPVDMTVNSNRKCSV